MCNQLSNSVFLFPFSVVGSREMQLRNVTKPTNQKGANKKGVEKGGWLNQRALNLTLLLLRLIVDYDQFKKRRKFLTVIPILDPKVLRKYIILLQNARVCTEAKSTYSPLMHAKNTRAFFLMEKKELILMILKAKSSCFHFLFFFSLEFQCLNFQDQNM